MSNTPGSIFKFLGLAVNRGSSHSSERLIINEDNIQALKAENERLIGMNRSLQEENDRLKTSNHTLKCDNTKLDLMVHNLTTLLEEMHQKQQLGDYTVGSFLNPSETNGDASSKGKGINRTSTKITELQKPDEKDLNAKHDQNDSPSTKRNRKSTPNTSPRKKLKFRRTIHYVKTEDDYNSDEETLPEPTKREILNDAKMADYDVLEVCELNGKTVTYDIGQWVVVTPDGNEPDIWRGKVVRIRGPQGSKSSKPSGDDRRLIMVEVQWLYDIKDVLENEPLWQESGDKPTSFGDMEKIYSNDRAWVAALSITDLGTINVVQLATRPAKEMQSIFYLYFFQKRENLKGKWKRPLLRLATKDD